MGECIERLSRETHPGALFAQPPVIRFRPSISECACGLRLYVQKTRPKNVLSLNGPFVARETVLHCKKCNRVYFSEELLRLVSKHCNVAWDVLVLVGRSLFQRHRTTEQILGDLKRRNVMLSASEVGYLGRKFIAYLAYGHRQATPKIRQTMNLSGGYVLHLDATHEADAPALMTGMDSLSEFVLANVKIPTEHSDNIVPFLQKLRDDYGTPIACVHDMGTGILKAVSHVFPGIPDFVCHFHFLRDIGKDFIEPAYRKLRKCLRQHKATSQLSALVRETRRCILNQQADATGMAKAIGDKAPIEQMDLLPAISTYLLTLWCLRGKHSGNGYGFPFDRPLLEFSERLLSLIDQLPELLMLLPANGGVGNRHFFKLVRKVLKIGEDPLFDPCVQELRWRCQVFDRLRKAMRIADGNGGNGLNDDGTADDMKTICDKVTRFRNSLDTKPKYASDPLCLKMAKQIDNYGDKLFADPIEVDTPSGKIAIYPQRTNNIMERFFREIRRDHRRKSGNNKMHKTLQAMLADTPLVKNLDNSDYVEILLDGRKTLEELFSDLDRNCSETIIPTQNDTDLILPGFRKLIKLPSLPAHVVHWATQSKEKFSGKSN